MLVPIAYLPVIHYSHMTFSVNTMMSRYKFRKSKR